MSASKFADAGFLAKGDALADELLAWLAPLLFREAADEREREQAYRLRDQAVQDVGMERPGPSPDGMERDDDDQRAVHILGYDETGRAIAACRLVFPAPDRLLPMERVFGPVASAAGRGVAGRVVEMGRVCVDARLRGQGGRIFMGLAARSWFAMRARGHTTVAGVTSTRLVTLFRALAFPVVVLGPPRLHWGVERLPILCEGPPAVEALAEFWRDQEGGASGPAPSGSP